MEGKMRYYLFLIIACIGIALGGKILFDSFLLGMGHDMLCGSAMLLFSVASVIAVTWKARRKRVSKP